MADITKTEAKKKGRESYSHVKADARKAKKQLEADQRQAKHDSLTLREKIAKATARGGSASEIKRLTERAAKKPEPKAPKVEVIITPKAEPKSAPKGSKRMSRYRQKQANN